MKLSERMRGEGHFDFADKYADEVAQLEAENEALKEAGQGILKILKTIMPNYDFQTNNSVTAMRALLIEIIGSG